MIIDANLQNVPGWAYNLGGNIGGEAPVLFGVDQSYPNLGMRVYVSGSVGGKGTYADGEAYLTRPICPNSGNLAMSYVLTPDTNAAMYAQAREFDVKVVDAQKRIYNFSSQRVEATGQYQISGQNGQWVSVPGAIVAELSPMWGHECSHVYSFDFATGKYSYVSITIDGVTFTIPPALQNLTALASTWEPNIAVIQVQQDLNALAGGYTQFINNLSLSWS